MWNAYVFIAPVIPNISDFQMAVAILTLPSISARLTRKFDTECVRVRYRRADVKRQGQALDPRTQSQPAPGSLPLSVCLRRWRDSQVQRVWPKREEKLKSEHVLTKTAEGYGPLKERLARKQNSQPELPFHLKCETHGPLWKYTSFKGKAWCVKDKTKHVALLSWKNIIFRRYPVLSPKVARGLYFILRTEIAWITSFWKEEWNKIPGLFTFYLSVLRTFSKYLLS